MRYYILIDDFSCKTCSSQISACKVDGKNDINVCVGCGTIRKEYYDPNEYMIKIRKKVFDLLYSN